MRSLQPDFGYHHTHCFSFGLFYVSGLNSFFFNANIYWVYDITTALVQINVLRANLGYLTALTAEQGWILLHYREKIK